MMTELMLEAPGPNGPLAVFRKTKEQDTALFSKPQTQSVLAQIR
jgi:hypothetical protein